LIAEEIFEMILKDRIELLYSQEPDKLDRQSALQTFNELKFFLNIGDIRAAAPSSAKGSTGGWIVNEWVKKGILLGFRLGELIEFSIDDHFRFFDKNTYPLKKITLEHHVRLAPGGSSIRDGAFIAQGVVIMPPAFINIGAYLANDTMVDSHVLVGSCAQIGKRVHLSAGAQIGGMLEPMGETPVIIEDDVFIGGNCGIFEGTMVKQRAVIAAGVNLTGSTPVFDVVNETVYRGTNESPLIIPEGAVVIAGSRILDTPFAQQHHLALYSPVIMKYRDKSTDAATALEASLR
jgi:2,3,4,5-tetrahydropyridine-2,6-dicarboxylate N-succinyltransferase